MYREMVIASILFRFTTLTTTTTTTTTTADSLNSWPLQNQCLYQRSTRSG